MANFLENLIGHTVAGGMRGGMEGLLNQEEMERIAMANAIKRGGGAVPEYALERLMAGGWTPYPTDVGFEKGREGYTYMESPGVRTKRERTEGHQKKLSQVEGYDFYKYLRDVEKMGEKESATLYEKVFDRPWIEEEEKPPTAKEEMKLFPEEEKPEKGKELGAKDLRVLRLIPGDPKKQAYEDVEWMKRMGYEIDKGTGRWVASERVDMSAILREFFGEGEGEIPSPVPPKGGFYGATSIAELEGALNSDPGITKSMKAKMLEDARKSGLE